jgi:hypothetical protein
LSSEQGIYVAEAVASRNTKLAKGRFRAYDVQDEVILVLYTRQSRNVLLVKADDF